jgi:hypothetical protein
MNFYVKFEIGILYCKSISSYSSAVILSRMIFTTCPPLSPKYQLNHKPKCVIAGFEYKNKYKKLLEPGRIGLD